MEQDALAARVLADLRAQADANSTIAEAALGDQGGDVINQIPRSAVIPKDLKLKLSALEVVFGIFPRWTAMAMTAENAYVPGGNFDQNRRTIEVINEQRLVDDNGKLNPSPVVLATNRALKQSRTGQVSVNWDMVVRSLLGLCVSVGESATYLDKANAIDFSAAAEEKNEMALQKPGGLFTRDDEEKLLAELNALGRSTNRRSTRRELPRKTPRACLDKAKSAGYIPWTRGSRLRSERASNPGPIKAVT